ncbi:MAG: fumarylacetoacetate hydrolase family protein [Planctomycetota bacterium]|nr:fumarylacetoacetate hydrolase family protein [Planctomycetota bacterium]
MNLRRTGEGVVLESPSGDVLIRHVIGVGMNYALHAKEQGKAPPERPVFFTKNAYSAALDGEDIVIPRVCQDRPQVDFEAELAVVLGARGAAKDVPRERAYEHVLGFAAANDVSARWWQKEGSGGQFYRGKSFDTFCPLGPRLAPPQAVGDPHALRVRCRVNGQTMQDASTGDMIFDIPTLIAEATRGTTLPPGTVILTGTPSGVGMARTPQVFLNEGDVVEIELEKIGVIRNRVRVER